MKMKKLQIAFFILGAAIFYLILKNLDAKAVYQSILTVKYGFVLIFSQEIGAHILNTWGWKYAIDSELKINIGFFRLLLMRISGDGINYLTPSATLAGEFAKAHMMGKEHLISHRLSTVALAKITQTAAMAFISLSALIWLWFGHWNISKLSKQMELAAYLIAAIFVIIIILETRAAKTSKNSDKDGEKPKTLKEKLKELDRVTMLYIKNKPKRFFLSVFFFALAYLWGAIEAYLILHFLRIDASFATALLIEMLAVFLDGLFFAVPLKAGTQEATKVAIFGVMGLNPVMGFSFGIIRHLREILWALLGTAIFYKLNLGKRKD